MKIPATVLTCLSLLLTHPAWCATGDTALTLDERREALVGQLRRNALSESIDGAPDKDARTLPALPALSGVRVQIDGCASYPYGSPKPPATANRTLLLDLADGLDTGLQCLNGRGPMGPLHPYHKHQAGRLLRLFESQQPKTFKCTPDAMFATAVATSPDGSSTGDPLYAQLSKVRHPAVILDTYRLGGLLSRRFDDTSYRLFFGLADEQILEHRNGQPLRADNLHRYQNRAALLFHEVVHWLGHQHSATDPDLAHLYETCCFGGSDYISDSEQNREYQQTACTILKDGRLWAPGNSHYAKMRLWRHKGYDQLKSRMRADYDE